MPVPLGDGIEIEQPNAADHFGEMREPLCPRRIRKGGEKGLPIVVVAEEQPDRHGHAVQNGVEAGHPGDLHVSALFRPLVRRLHGASRSC